MNKTISCILHHWISFLLLYLLSNFCILEVFSQETNSSEEPEIFTIVEEMPYFPGGDTELWKYFADKIYPPEAKAKGIEGVVVIGFVVAKNGGIQDVELIRDIGGGCGEEVVRLAKLMPKWMPGLQHGKPVNVAFKLPVRFKLEDTSKENNYTKTNYKKTDNELESTYNFSIGFTGGLHSPYGFGGEFSYMLGKNLDVNIGLGLGGSGLKTGIGARFFLANKEVSPYVGVNLIHATGLRGIRMSSDDTGETIYNTLSDQALHIKGGIKVNTFYNQYFYISGGYALTYNGYEAEYVSGFYNEQRQKLMNLAAVGGVQVTITYIIGFNTAKQRSWEGDSWGK